MKNIFNSASEQHFSLRSYAKHRVLRCYDVRQRRQRRCGRGGGQVCRGVVSGMRRRRRSKDIVGGGVFSTYSMVAGGEGGNDVMGASLQRHEKLMQRRSMSAIA